MYSYVLLLQSIYAVEKKSTKHNDGFLLITSFNYSQNFCLIRHIKEKTLYERNRITL